MIARAAMAVLLIASSPGEVSFRRIDVNDKAKGVVCLDNSLIAKPCFMRLVEKIDVSVIPVNMQIGISADNISNIFRIPLEGLFKPDGLVPPKYSYEGCNIKVVGGGIGKMTANLCFDTIGCRHRIASSNVSNYKMDLRDAGKSGLKICRSCDGVYYNISVKNYERHFESNSSFGLPIYRIGAFSSYTKSFSRVASLSSSESGQPLSGPPEKYGGDHEEQSKDSNRISQLFCIAYLGLVLSAGLLAYIWTLEREMEDDDSLNEKDAD